MTRSSFIDVTSAVVATAVDKEEEFAQFCERLGPGKEVDQNKITGRFHLGLFRLMIRAGFDELVLKIEPEITAQRRSTKRSSGRCNDSELANALGMKPSGFSKFRHGKIGLGSVLVKLFKHGLSWSDLRPVSSSDAWRAGMASAMSYVSAQWKKEEDESTESTRIEDDITPLYVEYLRQLWINDWLCVHLGVWGQRFQREFDESAAKIVGRAFEIANLVDAHTKGLRKRYRQVFPNPDVSTTAPDIYTLDRIFSSWSVAFLYTLAHVRY